MRRLILSEGTLQHLCLLSLTNFLSNNIYKPKNALIKLFAIHPKIEKHFCLASGKLKNLHRYIHLSIAQEGLSNSNSEYNSTNSNLWVFSFVVMTTKKTKGQISIIRTVKGSFMSQKNYNIYRYRDFSFNFNQ